MRIKALVLWFLTLYLGICFSCTYDLTKTDSFRDIFDHYRSKQGILAFSVPPALFSIILNHAEEGETSELSEFSELLKDLSAFRMIILETDDQFVTRKDELSEVIFSFTQRNGYNDLFRIQSEDDNIAIKILEGKETIKEAILVISSDDSFTVINLRGNIRPDHFRKLAESGIFEDLEGFRPW